MASKYDDILDSGAIQDNSIAAGSNKYAEILVEDEQQIQQSAFAASKVNPDKRAESIKLGKQVGLPTDVVERNYDDVKQKSELMAFKPDVLLKKSPGLSRWLQSPDNAAVGKDDLDNLQAIEKTVQDHSLMRTLHDSFTVGLARMNATASRIPALIYNTAAIPQNMLMQAIGKPERQVRAPDWLMNNPVAEHYQKTADYGQQIPALNESIFENIKSGDYSQAAKSMAAQLAANAPNQIAIIGGMVSGYGAATLAGAGVMSAAESNKEAQDAGADPVTGVTSSLAKGAIESGFESLGTYGILKHWEGAIAKSFGKESARQVMTDFVKTISYAAAGEANEEFATSIAQDMIDYLTGVNPKAIDGIMTRAVDAGLIGAASGGAMTGPSAITAGSARAIQARQAKIDKDFYLALGDTSEVSKVRERLPEAHKELVNEVTKDGPVSTVYIPVQAMSEYFQKKNIPPAQIANELGIQKEYDEAVETGSDVAIPTSVIADKLVGTEHYKALANDIKFSPTGLTVNEAKESEKEISDTAKEAETAVSETEKNYAASAKTVKETVKKQLIDTGMPSRDAEAQATLYESAFKSLGTRSGQDPLELFNKYGLTINGRRQDGTVLNQPVTRPNELGFYSKLEQTIEQKMGNSQPVPALKAMLKDIKPEEMKWSGLDEFLKGKEKVSKTEVLDFIRANQLDIKEVTKGGEQPQLTIEDFNSNYEVADMEVEGLEAVHDFIKPEYLDDSNVEYATIEEYSDGKYELNINGSARGTFDRMEKAIDAVEKFITDETGIRFSSKVGESGNTKFSQYTLPGGDNYREVLLTMPEKPRTEFDYVLKKNKQDKWAWFDGDSQVTGAFDDRIDAENIRPKGYTKDKENFTSSHFNEKNILAHVRLNDRVDADGKKVLFVEEIQSDWHQAGRKKGYKGEVLDVKAEIARLESEMKALADQYKPMPVGTPGRKELTQKYIELQNQKSKLENQDYKQGSSVPDAPFKKTWHEFALKRVIRMAAEQGYERVAWTTGEQQAERYDLSKQVDSVGAFKKPDGTFDIEVMRDGRIVMEKSGVAENQLDEMVGKDLAAKIVNEEGKQEKSGFRNYSGLDLKVGGEGMKGFYDNILVKSAEKLVKKFGGKVGEASLSAGEFAGWRFIGPDNLTAEDFYKINIKDKTTDDNTTELQAFNVARQLEKGKSLNEAFDMYGSKTLAKAMGYDAEWISSPKTTKVHSIDITPELSQAAISEGFSLFQENRGKISFGTDRKFNIELLKDANLSTFLHETGHFYLEVFGDLAEADGANQQIKDDFATLLDWFGVSSRADIKVEHHEQFARGFEAYLMDGKAPSSKLRKIFAKFKVWLTSIYRSIRDLDVQLTPEVRSVMDRLVAAEDEIKQAEAELETPAMFADPKAAGMSDAKAAQYIEAREEARLFAEEKIISQLMETVKRERTREYKDRRNQVKDEVTAQVDQMNVVKAQAMLQRGKMPDGSALPDGVLPIKLDKQSLIDMYSADFVKRLPRPYIYAREGGVHPDAAASILQFESGDALVQALVNTPPRAELIEQMTNQRMDQIYPDMLTDGSLPQESIDAVINEKRAQINRLELEWLQSYEPSVTKDLTRKIAQRKLPTSEQIKDQARRIIGSRAVGDIKPYLYLRAHVKYHNEAVKLYTKGDIDAAFEAKKKSVINEAIYNQALLANEDIKKSKQFFKRLAKKDEDVAKSRDVDLVNAARAILSQFGLDRTDKTADEYLQKMADYDPERYQSVKAIVDQATRRAGPYMTVQYDDFVAMKDAVESLWSLAKSEKEIEIDGKKMDIEIAKEELIAKTIETSSKKPKEQYNKTADKNDKFKVGLLGARASLTRIETWSDVMDVTHGGPFRRYIFQPISDATLKYRQERAIVLKKYEQLLRSYEKSLTKEKIAAPNLNFIFQNKAELMMAVLHSGNDSNLHKLLVGRGWATVNPDGTLDRTQWDKFITLMQKNGVLTKADYDFAQQVWDLLDSLKPETQKAHKLMYGYYFNEVTANDVVTPYGTYRGGYVPAKVDTYANEDAAIRREREEFEKNNNSFTYPTTGRGFTKSRVESYTAPLSLDMNLLGSHIDGVMRFTYIEPRVKEVSRLVLDKRFRKALGEIDQTVAKDALIPWLQRAAQQQVVLPSNDGLSRVLDGMASFLRANAATQIMFGNITNTLQQMTGMVVAMTKVKPKYVRNALVRYLQSPKKNTAQIHEKSAWMKDNQDNSIYDLSNSINEILLNPTTFQKFKDFSRKHTYFLQSHAQNIVNSVVWQGAYDQAVEQKMTEKEAVRFADSVVRTTQGTNRPEDISRFETGTKTELLFKQFVGYFNMLANLNAGELMKISRQVGLKKGAGRAFYIYMMGLAVPAILADAIVMAMAGKGLDQDDDDEYLDDILKSFFGSQFKTITATIPYGGQFLTAAYNKAFTPSKADDRVSLSPAISVLEGAVGAPIELYKRIADDASNEKKLTKDALTLLGVMTGLPTGPVGKPVGYLMDVQSGKAEPTGPVDFTRGLVTGRSGQ